MSEGITGSGDLVPHSCSDHLRGQPCNLDGGPKGVDVMFYYTVNGLVVSCNIELPIFPEWRGPKDDDDLRIECNTTGRPLREVRGSIDVFYDNGAYHIRLANIAHYAISNAGREMLVTSHDVSGITATIQNLPMSVAMLLKGRLLFHASATVFGEQVVAFCGPKGVGKSSLCAHLAKERFFFADDTLAIHYDDRPLCYLGSTTMKLTDAQAVQHRIPTERYPRVLPPVGDKVYVPVERIGGLVSPWDKVPIGLFCVMSRTDACDVRVRGISGTLSVRAHLAQHVVGQAHFPPRLIARLKRELERFCNSVEPQLISVQMPNDYERLEANCAVLDQAISTLLTDPVNLEGGHHKRVLRSSLL